MYRGAGLILEELVNTNSNKLNKPKQQHKQQQLQSKPKLLTYKTET